MDANNVDSGEVGVQVLVTSRGKDILDKGYGPTPSQAKFSPDTVQWMGEFTVVYFRYALLRLLENGSIASLDTTVESILGITGTATSGLTVRHLFSGTAAFNPISYPYDTTDAYTAGATGGVTKADRLDAIKDDTLSGTHGDIFWTTTSIAGRMQAWLIAHIIEDVTGEDWQDAIKSLVIDHIGLKNTFADINEARREGIGYERCNTREMPRGVEVNSARVAPGFDIGNNGVELDIEIDYGYRGIISNFRDFHKVIWAGSSLNSAVWDADVGTGSASRPSGGCGLEETMLTGGTGFTRAGLSWYANSNDINGRIIYMPADDLLVTIVHKSGYETRELNDQLLVRFAVQAVRGEPFTESDYMTDGVYTG